MGVRYVYRNLIKTVPAHSRQRYYQCRYDGKKQGQFFALCASVFKRNCHTCQKDFFSDYAQKKIYEGEQVLMELCKYDVISFDVFDTLIFRNVHNPADIFFQLEQELHMPGFAKKRIHAEQRARAEKYRDKNTREVVIEEIYSSMDIDSIAGFDTQEIMSREIDQELQCCYANPIMKKIVRILAGNHKTMIAVSDMYLHRNQIKQILQKSGYDEMKKIYSSGDFGVSKSDGRLFPIILSEWNASRLIHIGDNFFSDVYQQKHLNMKTLHYLC